MSGTVSQTDGQVRVAAIYARVSSERQRQDQTIASQTVGLRELAAQRGLLVPENPSSSKMNSSATSSPRCWASSRSATV